MLEKFGRVGRIRPFDESGIVRRPDGVLDFVDRPPSLVAMLLASGNRYGDRTAIREVQGRSLTYAELLDAAARTSGGLHDLGVRRGDRVGIRLPNGADWVVAYFGVQLAGAVAVPINTRLTETEVDYIVGDAGAEVVLGPERPLPHGSPRIHDGLRPDDLAAILYTSGTTGFPKGAMTTHGNLLSINETVRRISSYEEGEDLSTLVSVPLFHVTGCNSQLLPALELGGTAVILGTFEIGRFLQALVDERPTSLIAVPAIYAMALADPRFAELDVGHVTRLLYGGAPMAPELIGRLREAFPNARLSNGFGLTETASVCVRLPDAWCDERPDSVGFATPVVELDLGDVDEHGAGELLVRGPGVVAGYWGRPQQTAEAFKDGWLRTGDVATIDDDGFVQIVDRKKDVILRGGENVYSVEVENALVAHPAVLEAAVVGVPDDVMGERVGAVVVTTGNGSLDAAELLTFASARLAKYKLPEHVVVTSELLPRNPGGKVLKGRLRDEAEWGDRVRLGR
jgi:long-chain acyl-CoA synthetase